jgi:hypothetical protein
MESLINNDSAVIQLGNPINLSNPKDRGEMFSKTSVLTRATWYEVPEGIYNRLRVFENRVLQRIFGPKRDGVTGGWRKLHNELHYLCSSPSTIKIIMSRRMRWAGHVARMGEKRNVYRLLVGKPEGKRPLGRPRHRLVHNIKMGLVEI